MKNFIALLIAIFVLSANAETNFHLNGLFSTSGSGDIEEKPNSPGMLLLKDDGINITRKVTTCFSLSFCGPEIEKSQSILKIDNGRVILKELGEEKEFSETIILANNDRVILANAMMFSDSITIENWELQNSGNIVSNYFLSDLYLIVMGFIYKAEGSTGNIDISPDGSSVKRNLMICFNGCDMPTNSNFDITVVPGKKAFLTDQSSGKILENLIINADQNSIVLYEKNSNMITVWKPI